MVSCWLSKAWSSGELLAEKFPQKNPHGFDVFVFLFQNIRKYLLTEAKEKNHSEFLQGWQTAVTKVSTLAFNSGFIK